MFVLAFCLPSLAQNVRVEWFTPEIVHVVKTAKSDYKSSDIVVIAKPESVKVKLSKKDGNTVWASAKLRVELSDDSQRLTFLTPKGETLLTEEPKASAIGAQAWRLDADEAIYGLGILQNGKMSQRGENRVLCPGNTEDGMPFFQSAKGYGIYWDNYSATTVSDKDNVLTFKAEVAEATDYYFIYGGNADGVVAGVRHLTGDVPMFPLWTYGFHQSRERYKTQDELLEVVETYRKQQIPFDGIIQDWQYWGSNYLWNAMEFNAEGFNHADRMIKKIHDNNAHLSISIWQSFGPYTKQYREMEPKGMLFDMETWPQSGISHVWPPRFDYPSGVRVYDAYSDEARDIYWNHLRRLYDMGVDAWWMDSTEPDHHRPKASDFEQKTAMGTYKNVRCLFPFRCVGGVYEHQRATSDSTRVFILTRSGFIGQQRFGCNVWSGDVGSSWENLRAQVPAGLNFSLTGNPNFNSDLGGFFASRYNGKWNKKPGQQNPAYRELYVRWMQQGVFTPMMRSHGTEVPREIYLYGKKGEPVYDALVDAIRLRYRLLPYIYSTAWQASSPKTRSTMMRALVMDFPKDKKAVGLSSEYMFGKSVLATPILRSAYTPEAGLFSDKGDKMTLEFTEKSENSFYLPAGSKWYYFHNNEAFDGGQDVKLATALGEAPFFVRAGSILPLGPDVQYAAQKDWNVLEVRVYPGADGSFTLYEDEFDNYNYEKGKYSETLFTWSDKSRTLTIHPRKGSYKGMPESRVFLFTTADGKQKDVAYSGKTVKVKL